MKVLSNCKWKYLKTLSLYNNEITDNSIYFLGSADWLKLHKIYLGKNL